MEQQRIVGGLQWHLHQFHAGLVRSAAPLADIAIQAAADDVFPGRRTAATFRHDMVQAQFVHPQPPTAVLTAVLVA